MKIRKLVEKIQNLPERKRKIILWLFVVVIGSTLLIFWFKNTQKIFRSFPKKELEEKFQSSLQEKLKEMPKIEIPTSSEEEIKKLEEMMKEKQ